MRFFDQFFLLFFLLLASNIQGQNTYKVYIQIPDSMEGSKLLISLDDGIEIHSITDSFKNNKLEFTGDYFSEFATLKLLYKLNNSNLFAHSFFIGKKPVSVIFKESKIIGQEDPFKDCQTENVFDIYESDIYRRRNEFSKKEINDMNTYWETGNRSFGHDDSLNTLVNNLNRKDLKFIKNNQNEYFSFWWFRTSIFPIELTMAKYDSLKLLNLLNLFQTVFSAKLTNSPEGKSILDQIVGRLSVRKNYAAPDFEVKNIYGGTLRSNSLRGKYILLDFWATWCPPCMKQIPFLKSIREDYSKDSLVIISISGDVDYKKFNRVIQEKKMNWIHVYDSKFLPHLFGISAYPTLILIDDKGVILYDGKQGNQSTLIELLKQISKKRKR